MHVVRDHCTVKRLDFAFVANLLQTKSQEVYIDNCFTKTVHKHPNYISAGLIPHFKAYLHIYEPEKQERDEDTAVQFQALAVILLKFHF